MFRKATDQDISAIEEIYSDIHTNEEKGLTTIGWMRGYYPTTQTITDALDADELFVLEEDGKVIGAARINHQQDETYKGGAWAEECSEDEVMVLHTLVVSPKCQSKGYGKQFLAFYEEYAKEHGCKYLRIDTGGTNMTARSLYGKYGFKEVSILPITIGPISFELVLLEKKVN